MGLQVVVLFDLGKVWNMKCPFVELIKDWLTENVAGPSFFVHYMREFARDASFAIVIIE